MQIKNIFSHITDMIFPTYCLGCDREGVYICDTCFHTLDTSGVFDCPVCHTHTGTGEPCQHCIGKMVLGKHIAIIPYREDALIGKIMHAYKYQFVEALNDVFEKIITEFVQKYNGDTNNVDYDYIVPVPLHKRRYVERGFNQAAGLARMVATHTKNEYVDMLTRQKYTKQQATLSRNERIENTSDAFILKKNIILDGKRVLVLDDVFTTGSTLNACASVLKKHGAQEVHSMSIARG